MSAHESTQPSRTRLRPAARRDLPAAQTTYFASAAKVAAEHEPDMQVPSERGLQQRAASLCGEFAAKIPRRHGRRRPDGRGGTTPPASGAMDGVASRLPSATQRPAAAAKRRARKRGRESSVESQETRGRPMDLCITRDRALARSAEGA